MNEFRVCESCGYGRGFHVSFKKEDNRFLIIFICPECGASYDLGIEEGRITVSKPVRGKDF